MNTKRRTEAFQFGMGVEPQQHCCAECGYTSANRKNFKRSGEDGEARTCSTGHYTDAEGNLKRAINPYARRR